MGTRAVFVCVPGDGNRTRQGAKLRKCVSIFQRSTQGPKARSETRICEANPWTSRRPLQKIVLTALAPFGTKAVFMYAPGTPHPLLSCGEIVPGLAAKVVIQELFHRNLLRPSGLGRCWVLLSRRCVPPVRIRRKVLLPEHHSLASWRQMLRHRRCLRA